MTEEEKKPSAASAANNAAVTTGEDEKAALKAAREEKKRLKAEQKRLKKEKAEARQKARNEDKIAEVTYLSVANQDQYATVGDYARIMSRSSTGRVFCHIEDVGTDAIHKAGDTIWLRGRLQSNKRVGNNCFLTLRQESTETIQAVSSVKLIVKYAKTLTEESIVDVEGTLVSATVHSCSVKDLELSINRLHAVSKAEERLPFSVENAARSQGEIEASKGTEQPYPSIGQDVRLDHRWLDLRTPANNSIMRIQSAVCQLFRESLYSQGFSEIHTPKLIAGESESGAGVFLTDYFGSQACLAQSPQLYKQMAISSDMNRVFEVAPVFRAEKSLTTRHLCEFTGLDLEMAISDHYEETLEVIHAMFKHIFTGLESRWAKELAVIRAQYPSKPVAFTEKMCLLHWPEAIEIWRGLGFDVGDGLQDPNGDMELALGKAVKEKYGTDFFILDKYPSNIRPFYTMPDPEHPTLSNSYDIFLRGQEICSGAQRCHDPELLADLIAQKGIQMGAGLQKYVESFRHGVSPHAGAGIGLERVVFLYLGLDSIKKASMFPRTPLRCLP